MHLQCTDPQKTVSKECSCSNLLSYSFLQNLLITSFWNLSRVSFFSISLNVHGSAEYSFESSECQQLAASRPDFTRIIRTSSLSSKKMVIILMIIILRKNVLTFWVVFHLCSKVPALIRNRNPNNNKYYNESDQI